MRKYATQAFLGAVGLDLLALHGKNAHWVGHIGRTIAFLDGGFEDVFAAAEALPSAPGGQLAKLVRETENAFQCARQTFFTVACRGVFVAAAWQRPGESKGPVGRHSVGGNTNDSPRQGAGHSEDCMLPSSCQTKRPHRAIGAQVRPGLLALSVVAAIVATPGCATIAKSMARSIARRSVERTLTLPGVPSQGDVERFAVCVNNRGGLCPPAMQPPREGLRPTRLTTKLPEAVNTELQAQLRANERETLSIAAARIASNVLNHPVQEQVNDLYNLLQGVPKAQLAKSYQSDIPTLQVNFQELERYRQDLEVATALGGWDALAARELRDAAAQRRAQYIAGYLKAYFRDGRFFQFSLTTKGLVDRLKAELKKSLPLLDDKQIETLVTKLLKEYLDLEADGDGHYPAKPIFGKLGSGGFVARGGKGYQFPSVEAKLDPTAARKLTVTKVDFVATGSDVERVLLHAIFDADMGLPAVTNATGTMVPQDPLPTNEPATAGHLSDEQFGEVEVFADRLEAIVGGAVGRVVRGIGWVSLNNEALATLIETAVAVAVRKVSEKLAWCWFSCTLGGPTLAGAEPLEVTVRISGADALIDP